VEWLGLVPAGWEIKELRYLGEAIMGLTYQPEDIVEETDGVLVLRASNIQKGKLSFENNVYVKCLIPSKLRVKINDILICTRNGSRALIGKNALISNYAIDMTFGVFTTVFRGDLNLFLYWIFNSHIFEAQAGQYLTSTINQLTINNLYSLMVAIPPVAEQQAITFFLDRECARIDAIIEKKGRLLELLEEKRRAVITQAVTRGLNPNVPMKNSGVEWLGQVPRGREMKRLKFCAVNINQKCSEPEANTPFVALEHIEPWTGKLILDEESKSGGLPNIYQPNDVLFCKLRPYLAKVHFARTHGNCTAELLVLRSKPNLNPNYLYHFLISKGIIDCITASTYGAKMPRANWEFIENLPFPIPLIEEQQAIAAYLDATTSAIDAQRRAHEQSITLLQEYRASLITHAVTGKIDVRESTPRNTSRQDGA
jgi:restriction endonuclease S subunit